MLPDSHLNLTRGPCTLPAFEYLFTGLIGIRGVKGEVALSNYDNLSCAIDCAPKQTDNPPPHPCSHSILSANSYFPVMEIRVGNKLFLSPTLFRDETTSQNHFRIFLVHIDQYLPFRPSLCPLLH